MTHSSNSSPRRMHFIGSLPAELSDSPRHMMQWFADHGAGHRLTSLPCDPHTDWIVSYLRDLEHRDVFELVRPGEYTGYDDIRAYRVRRGADLLPQHVSMRRDDRLREIVREFRTLRDRRPELAGLRLQLSLPNPLDLACFVFPRPWRSLRHLPVFTQAAVDEVTVLSAEAGQDVVWQLETPSALIGMAMVRRLPGMRSLATRYHVEQVVDLLVRIPRDTRITVHLCYGDLGNVAKVSPRDLAPAVLYLNLLAERLRARELPLPAVHIPAAYGAHPAPTAEWFYRPLRELDPGWRVIAGVASAADPAAGVRALALFEAAACRRAYAVSTACGLGRHTPEAAERAARSIAAVACAVAGARVT